MLDHDASMAGFGREASDDLARERIAFWLEHLEANAVCAKENFLQPFSYLVECGFVHDNTIALSRARSFSASMVQPLPGNVLIEILSPASFLRIFEM